MGDEGWEGGGGGILIVSIDPMGASEYRKRRWWSGWGEGEGGEGVGGREEGGIGDLRYRRGLSKYRRKQDFHSEFVSMGNRSCPLGVFTDEASLERQLLCLEVWIHSLCAALATMAGGVGMGMGGCNCSSGNTGQTVVTGAGVQWRASFCVMIC